MSDLQKTFDKVARHLLTQNQPARNGDVCVYRAAGGLKCAIGCLIPDELYSKDMEGRRVANLLTNFPKLKTVPEINGFVWELVDLQTIHDGYAPPVWPAYLADYAKRHNLSTDVLKEFA